MTEMNDEQFDALDRLVQRALAGEGLGDELARLSAEELDEFHGMLEARGGEEISRVMRQARDVQRPTESRGDVARFLELFWKDRAQDEVQSLATYLALFPDDPAGVARCYLALEEGDREHPTSKATGAFENVAQYRLEEILGRGGQATVYRAHDPKLGRQVALKVFDKMSGIDSRGLDRFRREARAISRLSHPNIGQVYEAGVDNGRAFIAMELISGGSLGRKIQEERAEGDADKRRSKAELDEQLAVLVSVARALESAHELGIIHRDLKPGNILLRRDGSPVLLDFGLAKIENDESPALTATQDLLGTPAYLAPERLREPGLQASRLEDVYALGVTAYERLSGKRPFEGPTVEEIFQSILHGEYVPLDQRCTDVSTDLAVVIGTAMEMDLRRRYRSAAQFADDLDRVRRGENVSVRAPGWPQRTWRWYRRNAVIATFTLVVIVTLVTAIAVTMQKNRRIEGYRKDAEDRADELATSLAEVEILRGEAVERGDELATTLGQVETLREEAVQRGNELEATLKQVETLRAEAVQRGDDLARSLNEISVLSDVKRVNDLIREEKSLWPIAAETAPRIQDWLQRASAVAARGSEHAKSLKDLLARRIELSDEQIAEAIPAEWAALQDLRRQLTASDHLLEGRTGRELAAGREVVEDLLAPRIAAYEAIVERVRESEYPQATDAWRADVLQELVDKTRTLTRKRIGLIDLVRFRYMACRSVVMASITTQKEAWKKAAAELATDPRFEGFELRPQPGLVPLGKDPKSGLQEFLHLLTHDQDHLIARDASGALPPLDPHHGLIMVLIPGGEFRMGSVTDPEDPDFDRWADDFETPAHTVRLDPFYISKYEVWQRLWDQIAQQNPSVHRIGMKSLPGQLITGLNPVENVSWYDAVEVLWHYGMRLPTEAQWERAARGGTNTIWTSGNDLESCRGRMNIADAKLRELSTGARPSLIENNDDGFALHAPVNSYAPNAYGLYQMEGNVFEWCLDRYALYGSPVRDGDGLLLARHNDSDMRMFRGGAFGYPVTDSRCSRRLGIEATSPDSSIGLRPIIMPVSAEESR